MKIETSRLLIRPISQTDKELVFEYRSDKGSNKYQSWIPETINDVETFIGKVAKQINEPETWFQFVIIEKKSEKIIGDLGIHFFGEENLQIEIGCTLNKLFQNKGYATESVESVIDYLFNDLKKHRIITSIDPENKSSIKLVERLGFRKEAHFIESLFINGKWVDDIIYAITKKEWDKKKKTSTVSNFPTLTTDRFVLRQFNRKDLENVYKGLSHPDVIKYYGISFETLEATKEQITWFRNLEINETGIWWAICNKEDLTFIGAGGFNDLEKENRKAEIGFWLLPENWGKGIMKEVMPVICDFGFKILGLHRIEGFVDSENKNCKNGLRKLNFELEGTMKDCEVKNGKYVSLDIYSMINKDK
ncbi:GNAT family N-acetyltransferase [Marixanthotalea marina]|uniref:GNAT family N-acetyltransferase n=1 Tax=Marixanthotalea marina TaxID=2844359 RepID=UPI002989F2F6|nr:GNAT family protein [Marixanthotalea marina]